MPARQLANRCLEVACRRLGRRLAGCISPRPPHRRPAFEQGVESGSRSCRGKWITVPVSCCDRHRDPEPARCRCRCTSRASRENRDTITGHGRSPRGRPAPRPVVASEPAFGEPHALRAGYRCRDPFGDCDFELVRKRERDAVSELALDRRVDHRVSMAKENRPQRHRPIEVLVAIHIPDPSASATRDEVRGDALGPLRRSLRHRLRCPRDELRCRAQQLRRSVEAACRAVEAHFSTSRLHECAHHGVRGSEVAVARSTYRSDALRLLTTIRSSHPQHPKIRAVVLRGQWSPRPLCRYGIRDHWRAPPAVSR